MGVFKAARSLILLIVLVVGLYFAANSITNYTGFIVSDFHGGFESCLDNKDIKLYVDDYDMVKLKNLKTGEYLGNVEISGCVLNKFSCISAGIVEYPTWIIEGELVEGDIDIFTLADLAGCDMI